MTVRLEYHRYHSPGSEEHDDVHEAIDSAWGMVEWNEAAPSKLVGSDGHKLAAGYDIYHIRDEDQYHRGMTEDEVRLLYRRMRDRGQRAQERADAAYKAAEEARYADVYALVGTEVSYQFIVDEKRLNDDILEGDDPVWYPGQINIDSRRDAVDVEVTHRTGIVVGIQQKVNFVRTDGRLYAAGRHPLRHPVLMVMLDNGDLVRLEEVKRFASEGCFFTARKLIGKD